MRPALGDATYTRARALVADERANVAAIEQVMVEQAEQQQATLAQLRRERGEIVRILTSNHLATSAKVIQIRALLGVHDQFVEEPEVVAGSADYASAKRVMWS